MDAESVSLSSTTALPPAILFALFFSQGISYGSSIWSCVFIGRAPFRDYRTLTLEIFPRDVFSCDKMHSFSQHASAFRRWYVGVWVHQHHPFCFLLQTFCAFSLHHEYPFVCDKAVLNVLACRSLKHRLTLRISPLALHVILSQYSFIAQKFQT